MHTRVPSPLSDPNSPHMRGSPPAFLRTPINKSGLAHHNQSKVHGRRNHSAGGKRMRGNNTAAVRSYADVRSFNGG